MNRNEIGRLNEIAPACEADFKDVGFRFVTLDLGGYEKGKMNIL